ncbi:MAG: Rpp14/Pop5 family protein [Candidatus Heimdallarchaeaceae archaeon]|jgi:RNase P/RNase MRP subunit POP5
MVIIERDRYVVFQILSEDNDLKLPELKQKIWQLYKMLYGVDKTSEAGLYFEEYDNQSKKGLIRCSSNSYSSLMTTLAMITEIDNKELIIIPTFVSGLIKKAKSFLISGD